MDVEEVKKSGLRQVLNDGIDGHLSNCIKRDCFFCRQFKK